MLIATLPLLPRYRYDIVRRPSVHALRYNTVMPRDVDIPEAVRQLHELCGDKPLWLDLKTRQLRITQFAYLPYDYVELSHTISVDLPAQVHFRDGVANIESVVDGHKLILAERPLRTVGAGEPVNILEPSLQVEGFLTAADRDFMAAARAVGRHQYMLSFVESKSDIDEVLALDPDAEIIAKIESQRGLDFVRQAYREVSSQVRLMAARDDLYIHMGEDKMAMLGALQCILGHDPEAIAASRILTSLLDHETVSMGDVSDLHMLHLMGYRSFMLSDEICRVRDAFHRVIRAWEAYPR